jgi:hypothetical protein
VYTKKIHHHPLTTGDTMTTTAKKIGGAGRREGLKPLVEGGQSVVVPIRCSPEQREQFHALGGADWFRRAVLRAKLPNEA